MRNALSLAAVVVSLFLFPVLSSAQVSVTLSSPASGATVSSPFTVSARASGTYTITGWYIYLDNSPVWSTPGPTSSISASVSAGAGGHQVHVRAWQSNGAYGDAWANISVGSTSSTTPGLPIPPSTAAVFSKLEETTTNWSSCSTCAGGTSTTNYWSAAYQSSPSQDGSSRVFFNGGNAWSNVLWIKKLGDQSWAKNFLWDFWVYYDSNAAAHLWTAEFDLWQAVNKQEFMIGSQCNFGQGRWDVWSASSGHWIGTSVPCPRFAANTWHHIQWYVQRVSWNQYKYVTLAVDGKAYSLNQVYYTNYANWANSLGVQWQLDLDSTGLDAKEWIDQTKLTIW